MAKEISIVFVYDTQRCQKEEDDPQDAVIYFYPSWVSEQQRLALCGQLMGAMHFSVSMFSCPSILTLQNGKFALRRIGQYILAVGSDSPTPDWVLKHQTETLHQLIQFYHKDFDSILNQALNDGSSFVEKLSAIFDFYLPIAQQAGEMFDNIPTVILPKSASNVFLEAFHILHCCQEKKGVLGGTVLYQNKVIATQLSPDTTKRLVFTDPFNKTGPAENVSTSFHLPVGAHLLHVFISSHEFQKLRESAVCARESFENVTKVRLNQMKGTSMKIVPPKELSLGSKKESSRIPTVLEEGEGEAEGADQVDGSSLCKASYVKPKTNNVESTVRNLTNRTDSVARHPSGSCTPMTPMKDVNKVLHLQALSICKGSDETDSSVQEKTSKQKETSKSVSRVIKNIEKKTKKLNKSDFLVNYWGSEVRSLSLDDFREKQLTSNRIPLRYYSFGLPKLTRGACGGSKNGSPVHEPVSRRKHSFYNTITDPWYPVFRCDGLAVSKSLFDQYLEQHYTWLNSESKVKSCRGTPDGVSRRHSSPQEFKTFASVIPETSSAKHKVQEVNVSAKEVLPMGSAKREVYRRSLSLPLKTLAINGESDFMQVKDKLPAITPQGESALYQGMVINQITPMTPDISLLQFTNRLPGFNSTASTPCETKLLCEVSNILSGGANKLDDYASRRQQAKTNQRDPSVSASEKKPNLKDNSSMSDEEAVLQQATLYIYGQQNMALLLLVEDVEAKDPELIHSLWETCMSSLPHLESRTRQCLEHLPNTEQCDMYSYLCFDSSWDTLQSGGSWEPLQLDVVHHLHHNFVTSPGLTEIVVRSDEHIIYAYQCCRTEVFYQQNTGNKIGIPTPSDLMGLVSLKAKRRLERDHGIVLL